MDIDYDTEFLEDGKTIELISIGMVREDGAEYYAVAEDAPWDRILQHQWLCENVLPSLPGVGAGWYWHIDTTHKAVKPKAKIAEEVAAFLLEKGKPELWAWYGAYDHVALCQLWGRMIDLPEGVPMWTNDIRQEAHRLGNPRLPEQPAGAHNALMDARHNRVRRACLADIARRATGCRCYPE